VHTKSAAYFLKTITKCSSEQVGGEKMINLSKRKKMIIAVMVAIAIVLVITIPYVSAQTIANDAASNIKTLAAQGNIYQKIDGDTIKYYQASLTLSLQSTSTNGNVKKFDVTGGTLVANGVTYTFTGGNGGVLTGRHNILLQSQGTGANGQVVTLKLAGHYSYSWLNHEVVVRIGAKLQTQDSEYTLLLKTTIPVSS
jgi:hypothetical protein